MAEIDPECNAIARLFSQRSVRSQSPVMIRSKNPIFKKSGTSFDLKSIREYQLFDDLRKIDWRLYGRTERFFIKEFYQEENERIFLLIDSSASVKVFDLSYYTTFIASLAYLFLKLRFSVSLISFSNRLEKMTLNLKESKNISYVLQFLDELHFRGSTGIVPVLKTVKTKYQPGTVFLFSDLFDPEVKPVKTFKNFFMIHFFKPISDITGDFGDVEIEDEETGKRILLPFNALTRDILVSREKEFLKRFPEDQKNYHYFLVQEDFPRIPFYWKILEILHD